MLCPYLFEHTKVIQQHHYEYDENSNVIDSQFITAEKYKHKECLKEQCAVYYNGKCNYKK